MGSGWSQSQIRYYIYAVLFVMFDIEAVFIFPWAIRLEEYGTFGLIEMLMFIAILAVGLVYAWRKRVLRWVSSRAARCRSRSPKLLNTQPQVLDLGLPVGPGVLCHRDGGRRRRRATT